MVTEPSACNSKGFTLIEILVSSSIIAIIFSIIFGVFFNVLAGKERGEGAGETYQTVRMILSMIEKDVRAAALFKYNSTSSNFIGEDRDEGGASMDTIRFTSLSSHNIMSGIPGTDQNMIEYLPIYDPNSSRVILYRNEFSILIEESFNEEERVDLSTDLYGLNFRYFSGGGWHDTWNSGEKGGLPGAVEIEITMLNRGGDKISLMDVVMIETKQDAM